MPISWLENSGPGILYIYPGLIVPVRLTISMALLFISVKANVVAFYQGLDWTALHGHILLVSTAIINSTFSTLSLLVALIRDEDKLPPRVRWNCATFGMTVRILLFGLTVFTTVTTAVSGTAGSFRVNELALAEITLTLLLICLAMGVGRKLRTMRAAHEAGEEEVQRELLKREAMRLTSPTDSSMSLSSPQTLPPQTLYDSDDRLRRSFSASSAEKGELAAKSTVTLVNTQHMEYERNAWEPETPKLPAFQRQ